MAATPPAATTTLDVLTIERPEQLKALGHPLRLRVLELLGDSEQELSNRELANRLGVDPGHLHFHVRMLLRAGLIELVDREKGREKPYRAVARAIRVSPELLSAGLAGDVHAAMLEQVQRGWVTFGPRNRFRAAQLTAKLQPEQVRELWQEFVEKASELEDPSNDALLVTLLSHPTLD